MGREVKRVALDFNYPINSMIWKGYHNPYSGMKCAECDGTGDNPQMRELQNSWYGENYRDGWNHNITQDEVQALIDADRLWDFTRVPVTDEHREIIRKKMADGGNSWLPFDNGVVPTAEQVNEWSKKGFGHDSINRWVCVKARAKRLGIDSSPCKTCEGEGCLWPSPEFAKLAEDWQRIEPPEGEGYQLWSTTTEGTPMSPVFAQPEALARWLADTGASTFGSATADYETWLKFVRGPGWALSMVGSAGGMTSGVDFAVTIHTEHTQ